jgi:hypothetical protein
MGTLKFLNTDFEIGIVMKGKKAIRRVFEPIRRIKKAVH